MTLQRHLKNDEELLITVAAQSGEYGSGKLGTTAERTLYIEDDELIDICNDSVSAIEYRAGSYPMEYLQFGVPMIGLAVISWLVVPLIADLGTILSLSVGGLAVGGLLVILLGALEMRKNTLQIHTSSKSYEFKSKSSDLETVVVAIRS